MSEPREPDMRCCADPDVRNEGYASLPDGRSWDYHCGACGQGWTEYEPAKSGRSLSTRQTAYLLASLRNACGYSDISDFDHFELAGGGRLELLNIEEVDELCEAINCGDIGYMEA